MRIHVIYKRDYINNLKIFYASASDSTGILGNVYIFCIFS